MIGYADLLEMQNESPSFENYSKMFTALRYLKSKGESSLVGTIMEELNKRYILLNPEGWIAFEALFEWINSLGGSYEMGTSVENALVDFEVELPPGVASVRGRPPYQVPGLGYGADPNLGMESESQERRVITQSLFEFLEMRRRAGFLISVGSLVEVPRVLPEMKKEGAGVNTGWLLEAPITSEELVKQPLVLCKVIGNQTLFKDGRQQSIAVCEIIEVEEGKKS